MKIMPLPGKADKDTGFAQPRASIESVLKEVDSQLHNFGLEIIKFDTDDKKLIVWKVVRR
jgi:hypothetical protein